MATGVDKEIDAARRIGGLVGDALSYGEFTGRGNDAERIVEIIDYQVSLEDDVGEGGRIGDSEVEAAFQGHVSSFLDLYRHPEFAEAGLPVIRAGENGFGAPIPVDLANDRSLASVDALLRQAEGRSDPDRRPASRRAWDPRFWAGLPDAGLTAGLGPRRQVARDFFGLLTASLWGARKSVASGGASMVNFTVDCTNHGYQLDYWPQFQFSPVAFGGGRPTRPVTATIPVNHYHFQGWINGAVTQDGGLYAADQFNTAAWLRAF